MNRNPVRISTESIPLNARLAFWQTHVANLLTHLECSSAADDPFFGSITAHMSAPANVVEIEAASHTIVRATQKVSQMEGQIYLCIQSAGEAIIEQQGRQGLLGPGDMILLDTSKAFSAEFPHAMSQLVLPVPRALLRERGGDIERLIAASVTGKDPLGKMTTDFVSALAQRLTEQAIDLAVMAFMSKLDDSQPAAPRSVPIMSMLADRGRAFIEANLRDHSLGPSHVAEYLGISTRHLSSIFANDPQFVDQYIRERRLTHCANDLKDAGQAHRTIDDIAFSWGFGDFAQFSHAFNVTFGITPREYRQRS